MILVGGIILHSTHFPTSSSLSSSQCIFSGQANPQDAPSRDTLRTAKLSVSDQYCVSLHQLNERRSICIASALAAKGALKARGSCGVARLHTDGTSQAGTAPGMFLEQRLGNQGTNLVAAANPLLVPGPAHLIHTSKFGWCMFNTTERKAGLAQCCPGHAHSLPQEITQQIAQARGKMAGA